MWRGAVTVEPLAEALPPELGEPVPEGTEPVAVAHHHLDPLSTPLGADSLLHDPVEERVILPIPHRMPHRPPALEERGGIDAEQRRRQKPNGGQDGEAPTHAGRDLQRGVAPPREGAQGTLLRVGDESDVGGGIAARLGEPAGEEDELSRGLRGRAGLRDDEESGLPGVEPIPHPHDTVRIDVVEDDEPVPLVGGEGVADRPGAEGGAANAEDDDALEAPEGRRMLPAVLGDRVSLFQDLNEAGRCGHQSFDRLAQSSPSPGCLLRVFARGTGGAAEAQGHSQHSSEQGDSEGWRAATRVQPGREFTTVSVGTA